MDELAVGPDLQYLQVISRDNKIGYSRTLVSVSPRMLRSRAAKNAGVKGIDHDGIEDAFVEKGSTLWYWSGAKWLKLSGGN